MTKGKPDPEDQKAADKAVAPDRLLDGEETSTTYPEDARHWISTYQELLNFKMVMLESTQIKFESMTNADARKELESTDLVIIRSEKERFERRLHFWRTRLRELDPR